VNAAHHHEHREDTAGRRQAVHPLVANGGEGEKDHIQGVKERPTLNDHLRRHSHYPAGMLLIAQPYDAHTRWLYHDFCHTDKNLSWQDRQGGRWCVLGC
jgi:hypothetical protein